MYKLITLITRRGGGITPFPFFIYKTPTQMKITFGNNL